jgi:hypothetical protein
MTITAGSTEDGGESAGRRVRLDAVFRISCRIVAIRTNQLSGSEGGHEHNGGLSESFPHRVLRGRRSSLADRRHPVPESTGGGAASWVAYAVPPVSRECALRRCAAAIGETIQNESFAKKRSVASSTGRGRVIDNPRGIFRDRHEKSHTGDNGIGRLWSNAVNC